MYWIVRSYQYLYDYGLPTLHNHNNNHNNTARAIWRYPIKRLFLLKMFEVLFSKVESITGASLFSSLLTPIRLGFLKIAFSRERAGG